MPDLIQNICTDEGANQAIDFLLDQKGPNTSLAARYIATGIPKILSRFVISELQSGTQWPGILSTLNGMHIQVLASCVIHMGPDGEDRLAQILAEQIMQHLPATAREFRASQKPGADHATDK